MLLKLFAGVIIFNKVKRRFPHVILRVMFKNLKIKLSFKQNHFTINQNR